MTKTLPNILVLAHEPYLNGASHSLLTLLNGLKSEMQFLVIVPAQGEMLNALQESGIQSRVLKLPRCAIKASGWFSRMKSRFLFLKNKTNHLHRLKQVLGDFKPDLIYTNTSVQDLGFDLSLILNKPHVWHIREYGDKDFGYQYLPSKQSVRKKMHDSNAVIFTTQDLLRHWNLSSKNQEVIYNGIVSHHIPFRNPASMPNPVRISIVGLIMPTKGQLDALMILRQLLDKPLNVHLQIFGKINDSGYEQTLRNFVSERHLQNHVEWKGYVEQDELYAQTDILLSCAQSEGFGRTLVEAMGREIPVVARRQGGPAEIIQDMQTGYLYDDIREAIEKIQLCIVENQSRIECISSAREYARTHFSIENYLEKVSATMLR